MRETTWKQDALSRPLRNNKKEVRVFIGGSCCDPTNTTFNEVSPGGLIKEHDGGIVDQLQSNGQSFTLTPGQTAGACLSTFLETQSGEDLIHLRYGTKLGLEFVFRVCRDTDRRWDVQFKNNLARPFCNEQWAYSIIFNHENLYLPCTLLDPWSVSVVLI